MSPAVMLGDCAGGGRGGMGLEMRSAWRGGHGDWVPAGQGD